MRKRKKEEEEKKESMTSPHTLFFLILFFFLSFFLSCNILIYCSASVQSVFGVQRKIKVTPECFEVRKNLIKKSYKKKSTLRLINFSPCHQIPGPLFFFFFLDNFPFDF